MPFLDMFTSAGLQPWIPMIVYALVVGTGGSVMKRLVLPPHLKDDPDLFHFVENAWMGWRGIFSVTMPLQSILVGTFAGYLGFLFGVCSHPAFGATAGGAAVEGSLAGVCAMLFYDAFIDRVQYWVRSSRAAGERKSKP